MSIKEIQQKREGWEQKLNEIKKSKALREEIVTDCGIPIKPLYTPEDVGNVDYLKDLGFPGEYPCVRGSYHSGYLARPWTMRHNTGFGGGNDTNERLKFLIKSGETGLAIIFDLPTQNYQWH